MVVRRGSAMYDVQVDKLVFYREATRLQGGLLLGGGAVLAAGGCGAVFGLAADHPLRPYGMLTLFVGAVLALIGIAALLWRSRVELLPRRDLGIEWSGVLGPMRQRRFPLSAIERVRLADDKIHTQQGQHRIYSVVLLGPPSEVIAGQTSDYAVARQSAERAAAFVGVSIEDEAGSQRFDAHERPNHTDAAADSVSAQARVQAHRRDDAYVFDLPVYRGGGRGLFIGGSALVLAAGGAGWIVWTAIERSRDPADLAFWVVPGVVFVLGLVVLYLGLDQSRKQERIVLDRFRLHRDVRNRFTRYQEHLDVARIQGLEYTGAAKAFADSGDARQGGVLKTAALEVRGSERALRLGQGLTHGEQRWLGDALGAALSDLTEATRE